MGTAASRQRTVTRADVAKLAGVSTAVVSYVLNDGPKPVAPATRARVLDAVKMLGYRPNAAARALSRGSSDLLALVVPTVEQPYFAHLAAAVEAAARAQGLSLIVANALPPRVAPTVRELVGQQLRGLILAAAATAEATREFLGAGIPTVLINQASPIGTLLTLGPDYRKGAADGVRHLIEVHGHRRIAYVGADIATDERAAGWRNTLRRAGLATDAAIEVEYSYDGGRDAVRILLREHPDVTAAFLASDQLAIGAIAGLAEAGRSAPGDLAIISFDGSPESAFAVPPLSTLDVPIQTMAEDAVDLLLSTAPSAHHRYDPVLLIRRSCGCP